MTEVPWEAPVDVVAGGQKIFKCDNPRAALVFADAEAMRRVLGSRDALVLAEAYVHSAMDIEGDIFQAIGIKESFYPDSLRLRDKARIVFNVLKSYRRHNTTLDCEYVTHHYNHPDEFYELFLGETMVYSCAYFAGAGDDLDTAQRNKLDHIFAKLGLRPGDRLLDIGCGWGSLVTRAATEFGAQALGITLSTTQCDYANQRIRESGIEGKCRVEAMHYQQLEQLEPFDKVVSVGMYEHIGGRNLSAYFDAAYRQLRPEGIFLNHGITGKIKPDWRKASEARFIDKYIFPGGELHPNSRVVREMESAGFEVYDVESLRKHYGMTLRHWVANLQAQQEKARRLVPEHVYRAWVLYMAGCALAFEEGYLNVHQVCGCKTDRFGGDGIAMTREFLYRNERKSSRRPS